MTFHLEFYQYLPQCKPYLGNKVLAIARMKETLQTCGVEFK